MSAVVWKLARGLQSRHPGVEDDPQEEPALRRSLQRLAMFRWADKVLKGVHAARIQVLGGVRLALKGVMELVEVEERGADAPDCVYMH